MKMRFAILNDIHYGEEERIENGIIRKFSKQSKELTILALNNLNNYIRPEFVLVLGDLIESKDTKTDTRNLKYMKNLLENNSKIPIFYCIGNHEQRKLEPNSVKNILGMKNEYYSFDVEEYHFIVLYSIEVRLEKVESSYNYIDDKQVNWLKNKLKNTSKKTFIFVHHCLSDQNLDGNLYFNNRENNCLLKNRKEIREIIEQSNNVICVFNGHIHWNRVDIHNSIPHITLQSLVENEDNKGAPADTYTIVDIDQNNLSIEVKGDYPQKYKFNII